MTQLASERTVPGPAAGIAASAIGMPNRLGSDRVAVRVYEPAGIGGQANDATAVPWATLVWAHGGSFVRGTLDWPEADWAAHRFAEAGLRVYSVDYALASETVKAPAPANDVAAVLRFALAEHPGPVLVGGASAGAHLAVAAALAQADFAAELRDARRAAAALALVYPTLHRVQRPDPEIAALVERLPEQRRFRADRIAEMYDFYLGNGAGDVEPVGELPIERLAALAPTVMVNAEFDELRASGEQFAEQLRDARVPVTVRVQPGTVHGYLNRPETDAEARRDALATIDSLVEGLRAILDDAAVATEVLVSMEPAIEEATSLTLPNGRLNREAIGWASSPIIDTSGLGRGRGRNKRWEYWNVATPEYLIGLTVSHIDYACVHEVWVYERVSGAQWHRTATVIPARGGRLAPTLEHGRSTARAKDLAIDIDEVPGGTRLRAEIPGVSLDVVVALPKGHERLALVVPWSDKRFQYTVKDIARPACGQLRLDGVARSIGGEAGEAWAVLDHGRGRWPYDIGWNWGAGSGRSHGRVIGLQLGAKWTAGTGVSENAFFVDGRMHKIHGETRWEYDLEQWRIPWRVSGGGLQATFEPFHNKRTRTDLLVLKGHTDQCFGLWSGSFRAADGESVEFDGLIGWAEEVHNRW